MFYRLMGGAIFALMAVDLLAVLVGLTTGIPPGQSASHTLSWLVGAPVALLLGFGAGWGLVGRLLRR